MTHPCVEGSVNLDIAFVERVRHALETAFGSRFEVWYQDAPWSRVPIDSSALLEPPIEMEWTPDPPFLDLLDEAAQKDKPCCRVTDARESLLAIPLSPTRRTKLVATASFEEVPPGFLVRFARVFARGFDDQQQVIALRQENDAFLRQVTSDFEELTFLRSMAELLEVSDLTSDLVNMAEQVLPTLQPLLETDSLILVTATTTVDEETKESTVEVADVRLWEGLQNVTLDVCRDLVRRYAPDTTYQPVVKNNFVGTDEATHFPGVESFVLVPIVHSAETIGWLLALNRNNERNLNMGELPWEGSYVEFGTHEATLMSSSAAILATHSRNVELFREREDLLVCVVRALVSSIDAKDEYTRGHSERVALFGQQIAHACGLNQEHCERVYLAGLLHDVGKIGIRDAVLCKTGKLDGEEFKEIQSHPEKGWSILADLEALSDVLPGVLYHHETFDGRGYPDQLEGEGIPVDGRILAVADAFDAMTSDRPYRAGMPVEKAEEILRSGAGKQWDPKIVKTMLETMPEILTIRDSYTPRKQTRRIKGTAKREPN